MKPFETKLKMPIIEKNFNYRLSSARMTIENSFGRLKARWRVLLRKPDVHVDTMREIIHACILLHNFCEKRKEQVSDRWMNEVGDEEKLQQQPDSKNNDYSEGQNHYQDDEQNPQTVNSKRKRLQIASKLLRDNLSINVPI